MKKLLLGSTGIASVVLGTYLGLGLTYHPEGLAADGNLPVNIPPVKEEAPVDKDQPKKNGDEKKAPEEPKVEVKEKAEKLEQFDISKEAELAEQERKKTEEQEQKLKQEEDKRKKEQQDIEKSKMLERVKKQEAKVDQQKKEQLEKERKKQEEQEVRLKKEEEKAKAKEAESKARKEFELAAQLQMDEIKKKEEQQKKESKIQGELEQKLKKEEKKAEEKVEKEKKAEARKEKKAKVADDQEAAGSDYEKRIKKRESDADKKLKEMENKQIEVDKEELDKKYKSSISNIKNSITKCSKRSTCIEQIDSVLKKEIKDLEAKPETFGGSSSSYYGSSISRPKVPNLEDAISSFYGNKRIGESESAYEQRIFDETRPKYESQWRTYKSKENKYEDDLKNWGNNEVRKKIKERLESLRLFFKNAYDKDIFPTQKMLFDQLSAAGKKEYLAHVIINDPGKIRLYADESVSEKAKKDKGDAWEKIGAGLFGLGIGAMLGSSVQQQPQQPQQPGARTPTPPTGAARQYQRSGTTTPGASRTLPGSRTNPSTTKPYQRPGSTTQKPATPYKSPYSSSSPYSTQRGPTSGTGTQQKKPQPQTQQQQKYTYPSYGYQKNSYSPEMLENGAMLQLISDYGYSSRGSNYGSSSYGSSSYGSSSYSSPSYSSSSYKSGKSEIPPKEYIFNKDDILLFLISTIDRAQRSCTNHDSCFKGDKTAIERQLNSFSNEKDPVRSTLSEVLDDMDTDEAISLLDFDEIVKAFEKNGYQSTAPSDLKSKLRKDWEDNYVAKRAKARSTRDPKIINEPELKRKFKKVTKVDEKKSAKPYGYQDNRQPKKEEGGIAGFFSKILGG